MGALEAKVWRQDGPGGLERLQWTSTRVEAPGPGQVRLRQTYVGLNFVDIYQRRGMYAVSWPAVLGQEAVGVVESVGPAVDALKVRDRVGYVGLLGAYATARLAPADRLIPLPASVPDADAAALLFKGMTAELLVRRAHPVQRGEVVLVQAAAGGVGQLLCRWAASLGATVIGVVGSDEKARIARESGCEDVVVSSREDFVKRALERTQGRGVDAVYESVGGATFHASFEALRIRGTLVSFGQASGEIPTVSLEVLGRKAHTLTRPSLRHYIATREELTASASALFEQVARGVLHASIGQRGTLAALPDAQRALESRQTTGATVLAVE